MSNVINLVQQCQDLTYGIRKLIGDCVTLILLIPYSSISRNLLPAKKCEYFGYPVKNPRHRQISILYYLSHNTKSETSVSFHNFECNTYGLFSLSMCYGSQKPRSKFVVLVTISI